MIEHEFQIFSIVKILFFLSRVMKYIPHAPLTIPCSYQIGDAFDASHKLEDLKKGEEKLTYERNRQIKKNFKPITKRRNRKVKKFRFINNSAFISLYLLHFVLFVSRFDHH